MKGYEITINVDRLLHYSAVLKPQINNETLLMKLRSFSVYIRDFYKLLIAQAIYSPRYKGEWEPVEDEGYIEYLGTEPSGEDIMYLMYDALEIREIKNNIIIRFDPNYKYPGSRKSLLSVVRAIDTGTSKFNARPILKKINREIEGKLPSLWKMYLKKKGVG